MPYQGIIIVLVKMWFNSVVEMYSIQWVWWWEKYSRCLYSHSEERWDKAKIVVQRRPDRCAIDMIRHNTTVTCTPNVHNLKQTSVKIKR